MSDRQPPASIRVWRRLTDAQRLRAAEAFWAEAEGTPQAVEALALLAQRLKARPKFVAGLPQERRARYLAVHPALPEAIAARLLVSYHLAWQRPMMGAFLDLVGIPHEDGLIDSETIEAPPADTLAAAARRLRERFPEEDVSAYFATLVAQDPDTWGGLEGGKG